MATEKQRLANQRNAQKSTGPKTPEGKARSRRNSLKHGLTGAGVVMKTRDRREVAQRVEEWTEKLEPIDSLEHYLIERAATASVRTQRCVRLELTDLARRRRRAVTRWEQRQQQAVLAEVERLESTPGAALRALRALAHGCDWLIEAWSAVGDALAVQGGLTATQAAQVLTLLGKEPTGAYPADERVTSFRRHALATLCSEPADAGPDTDEPAPDGQTPTQAEPAPEEGPNSEPESAPDPDPDPPDLSVFGAEGLALETLPAPEEARAWLAGLVESQLAELRDRRERAWREHGQPGREEAQDRILVDTSNRGTRLLRYENSSEMTVHRNLNQLMRMRKVEPDHQTLSRWDKQGKDVTRFWVDGKWVTSAEYEVVKAARAAEADQRRAEAERAATPEPAPPAAADPAPGPHPAPAAPAGPVPGANIGCENEAIFSEATRGGFNTSGDSQQGSPNRPEAGHEPAQAGAAEAVPAAAGCGAG